MPATIAILVGTRPNFIKITQFKRVAEANDLNVHLIHTGQHYDFKMAGAFFEQLEIVPDHFLDIPQEEPAAQMGHIMIRLHALLKEIKPEMLIVPGDVNTTLAGALTANKMGIPLAHLESGLRSNDERMPEEINRILTDRISDLFFVTEQSGIDNLLKEGAPKENVFLVGNTMIDTLVAFDGKIINSSIRKDLNLEGKSYVLVTIHRPSNVDTEEQLNFVVETLEKVSEIHDVVFPIHPRTVNNLKRFGLSDRLEKNQKIILTEPLDYFSFQHLILHSKLVLTDSGGIQEETTFRKVPCLTLRENTERPITVTVGTNRLIPFDSNVILDAIKNMQRIEGDIPDLWDGMATERIVDIIKNRLSNR